MNEKGVTLIEALVAVAIIGIAISSVAPAFIVQMDTNTRNEERTEAAALAAQVMETLRHEDPADMPNGGSSDPESVTVGHRTYEVVVQYCNEPSYCGPGSRHIVTEVSLDGETLYTTETVYTALQ